MYYFKEAQTQNELKKLYRFRYEVYCVEQKFLKASDYPDKQEKDSYDEHSKHFIALNEKGDIVGTIRLILNSDFSKGLPIKNHPGFNKKISGTDKNTEISRLIVDKTVRNGDIALGLYRIMYFYSKKYKISNWYICVEPLFLQILNGFGFPFEPIGKSADYMGDTVPAMAEVGLIEKKLQKNNLKFYDWFRSTPATIETNNLIKSFL